MSHPLQLILSLAGIWVDTILALSVTPYINEYPALYLNTPHESVSEGGSNYCYNLPVPIGEALSLFQELPTLDWFCQCVDKHLFCGLVFEYYLRAIHAFLQPETSDADVP